MKLKNIVTNSAVKIIKTNVLIIVLTVVCFLRIFIFINSFSAVDKKFKSSGIIVNPVTVDKNQFVYKTSKYSVKSYVSLPVSIGDSIEFSGSRYNSVVYSNKITKIDTPVYLQYLYSFKKELIYSIGSYFMQPFASLILGMLYGIEPNFNPQFVDIMVKSGVIHIVVVSGYNISVLFSFIRQLLINFSLKIRLIISVFASIFYTIITGYEPPIIRALIFGIILATSKAYGFKSNTTYILFLVAICMLIVDPSVLISISFQLSFLATLGIILINPLFSPYINSKFKIVPSELRDSFISSFSAQLFVFPILLYYFKSFSTISILTNTLILWVVPIIMTLGFIYSCFILLNLNYVVTFAQIIFYLPLIVFVDFITFISKIPFSSISYSINIQSVFILYFLIFIGYLLVYKWVKSERKGDKVVSISNY